MVTESHLQAACCDLVADVVRLSGQVQLKVSGVSMVPVLWPGDLLTVHPIEPGNFTPGSVLVFRQNNRLVVHRLLRREGAQLVTRGDSRPCLDAPVSSAEILGRVEAAQRNGRSLSLHPSMGQALIAAALRRSEAFTLLYLRLVSRIRKIGVSVAAFRAVDPVRP
jgi:signal peptidase I